MSENSSSTCQGSVLVLYFTNSTLNSKEASTIFKIDLVNKRKKTLVTVNLLLILVRENKTACKVDYNSMIYDYSKFFFPKCKQKIKKVACTFTSFRHRQGCQSNVRHFFWTLVCLPICLCSCSIPPCQCPQITFMIVFYEWMSLWIDKILQSQRFMGAYNVLST